MKNFSSIGEPIFETNHLLNQTKPAKPSVQIDDKYIKKQGSLKASSPLSTSSGRLNRVNLAGKESPQTDEYSSRVSKQQKLLMQTPAKHESELERVFRVRADHFA